MVRNKQELKMYDDLLKIASEIGQKLQEYRKTGNKIVNVNQEHIDFVEAMIRFKQETNDVTISLQDMVIFLRKLAGG